MNWAKLRTPRRSSTSIPKTSFMSPTPSSTSASGLKWWAILFKTQAHFSSLAPSNTRSFALPSCTWCGRMWPPDITIPIEASVAICPRHGARATTTQSIAPKQTKASLPGSSCSSWQLLVWFCSSLWSIIQRTERLPSWKLEERVSFCSPWRL